VMFSSPTDAFPSIAPRPRAPDLNMRSFDVPRTRATHVRLRVVANQCTGGPDYAGEQDQDPRARTDCRPPARRRSTCAPPSCRSSSASPRGRTTVSPDAHAFAGLSPSTRGPCRHTPRNPARTNSRRSRAETRAGG
jgi:hypothetical protein